MTTDPAAQFDNTIHQRARFGILTILATTGRADFTYLRDTLELTDGNLGRHLDVLNEAGYVEINKTFEGRKPRTWVKITKPGRVALNKHIAALRQMIDSISGE
jgi:DNA-binding MarR family transcriptional regulator